MTDTLRVLVTGARKTTKEQDGVVSDVLSQLCGRAMETRKIIVVEGECPHDRVKCDGGPGCPHHSVDLAARRWAEGHDLAAEPEPHPADWRRHGKSAGTIRNSEMAALGAAICLAFPGNSSTGTWDCVRRAADAGIHVRIYPLGETPS